eukprot:895468-Rhodomonas_salina.1
MRDVTRALPLLHRDVLTTRNDPNFTGHVTATLSLRSRYRHVIAAVTLPPRYRCAQKRTTESTIVRTSF